MDLDTYEDEMSWKTRAVAVICPMSFIIFTIINRLVKYFGIPDRCLGYPDRWVAYAVSWIHAMICGSLSLIIVLSEREWMEGSPQAFYVHCMSAGYFAYDALCMWLSKENIGTLDIYLHHFVFCLPTTVTLFPPCGKVAGYAIWDYLCEITNVFLHGRKLTKMYGHKSSRLFHSLSNLFMVTFFIFRFFPQVLVLVMINVDFWISDELPLLCYAIVLPQQVFAVLVGSQIGYLVFKKDMALHQK